MGYEGKHVSICIHMALNEGVSLFLTFEDKNHTKHL